jgi:hypothetical protein
MLAKIAKNAERELLRKKEKELEKLLEEQLVIQ